MNYRVLLFTLLFVAPISFADELADYKFPGNGYHVMPASLGRQMLKPCSRHAPKGVTAFWQPSNAQIITLEGELLAYMGKLQKAGDSRPPTGSYNRQYIGIVVGGKRLIYGNFYPSGMFSESLQLQKYEMSRLADMCDSGRDIWGIVFYPKTKVFSSLSFGHGI